MINTVASSPIGCPRCGRGLGHGVAEPECPRCLLSIGLAEPFGSDDELDSATEPLGEVAGSHGQGISLGPLGDYEVLEEIARGGMGIVYKARQRGLNRIVALKTLIGGQFSRPDFLLRFRTEAEAAAQLRHPNIVVVHEAGQHQGIPFLAMEFVQGRSLRDLTQHNPLSPRQATTYMRRIADAVQHAHNMGILHRDLKPANILIDANDEPRITDFGLAKRSDDASGLTQPGQVIGSPNFMPPEQASFRPGQIGPWSDVFSMGAIFYHLVTGHPPFLSGSLHESIHMILETDPVSPRLLNPHLPKDLETIILKCLEKEPSKRYPTAADLAEECRRFLLDEPILARPTGRMVKFGRWCRRNPSLAALGAAVFFLLLTITAGSVVSAWRIAQANQATQIEYRKRRHSHYVGSMNVAWDAYSSGNLRQALSLLDQERPKPDSEDFRGFEWRYLWKLCQGTERLRFPLTELNSGNLYFLSDTRLVAATSDGQDVVLSEVLGQEPKARLPSAPRSHPTAFALAPSGEEITLAVDTLELQAWDLRPVPPRADVVESVNAPVRVLAYSQDGRMRLSVTDNGTVRWRVRDGGPSPQEARLPAGTELEDLLAISADLQTFALRDTGTHGILLWSPSSQLSLLSPPGLTSSIECGAFSPDGRFLATGSSDGSIRLWDLPSQATLGVLAGHRNVVTSLAFSHDHRTLASSSLDNTVKLWDLTGRANYATLKGHLEPIISLVFSPDDQRLATLSFDRTVRLWEVNPATDDTWILEHSTGVYSCVFSPEGRRLAACGADGTLLLWNIETRSRVDFIRAEPEQAGYLVRFADRGRRLLTQGVASDSIDLWDVETGEHTGQLRVPDTSIYDWDILAAGNRLVAAAADGRIVLFDLQTQRIVRNLASLPAPVRAVAMARDGRRVAAAGEDGLLGIWDIDSAAQVALATTPGNGPTRLLFFPVGGMLLTTHWDGTVQIRSVDSLQLLATFKPDYFYAVAISPDGQNIAFGCADQTIRIWNVANIEGELLVQKAFQISGHRSVVGGVCFSPDGNMLASCSEDQSVRLWRAPTLLDIDRGSHP